MPNEANRLPFWESEWQLIDNYTHALPRICARLYRSLFVHQKVADNLQISLRLFEMRHVGRLGECDPLRLCYMFEEGSHNKVLSFVETTVKKKGRSFDFVQVRDDSPILQWSSDIELTRAITADTYIVRLWQ